MGFEIRGKTDETLNFHSASLYSINSDLLRLQFDSHPTQLKTQSNWIRFAVWNQYSLHDVSRRDSSAAPTARVHVLASGADEIFNFNGTWREVEFFHSIGLNSIKKVYEIGQLNKN